MYQTVCPEEYRKKKANIADSTMSHRRYAQYKTMPTPENSSYNSNNSRLNSVKQQ